MKFRCKNLLVTGGAGFIGSNFIEYLFDKYKDLNIYNLDLLTYAGNLNNTKNFSSNKKYKFIKGNICDDKLLNEIFIAYNIDGVINFAAESHVDNSIVNPDIFIETNIIGVHKLLDTCYKNWMSSNFKYYRRFKHSRFHQISTDEVYGSIEKGSFDENSIYNPNSPYSASKASADMIVRSYNKTFGLNTTISISSNNFGPNQNKEKFIPKIINSIKKGKKVTIYGDGKIVRDWIYVKDNCNAIDLIYNYSKNGMKYNIGGNNELSNLDVFKIIHDIIKDKYKISAKFEFVNDRFGHDFRYSLDLNKIKNDLNWSPKSNFLEILKKIIEY